MSVQETITQAKDAVLLQVDVPEMTRRLLKAEAARAGMKMGDFLAILVEKYATIAVEGAQPAPTTEEPNA